MSGGEWWRVVGSGGWRWVAVGGGGWRWVAVSGSAGLVKCVTELPTYEEVEHVAVGVSQRRGNREAVH